MQEKKQELLTPLDHEPGACCQNIREEVAMLEAMLRSEQAKLQAREQEVQRVRNELAVAEQVLRREQSKSHNRGLELARIENQLKDEHAVNARLVRALETMEAELRRCEQGLTPPGRTVTVDHKMADLLNKWLEHWRNDYVMPVAGELVEKTREALEDFYGVHQEAEEGEEQ